MHRSGTSALARVLQLGGADLGARVVGASAGNEAGHWEDAFALELHERLLVRMGRRWDDVAPLLPQALQEAACLNAGIVGAYLRGDRASHALWAVKDPRLCILGSLWREQAQAADLPLGAIVVVRHPLEVAASLEARDGIGAARALLLWLQYTVGALQVAEGLPTVVLTYDELMRDWRAAMARVVELPGGSRLNWDEQAHSSVDAFLDPSRRHHRMAADDGALPTLAAELWRALSACAESGRPPAGLATRFSAALARERELIDPLLEDFGVLERMLWERVGKAEGQLAAESRGGVELKVDELRELVQVHHSQLVDAMSGDVRRMQAKVEELTRSSASGEAHRQAENTAFAIRIASLEASLVAAQSESKSLGQSLAQSQSESKSLGQSLAQSQSESKSLAQSLAQSQSLLQSTSESEQGALRELHARNEELAAARLALAEHAGELQAAHEQIALRELQVTNLNAQLAAGAQDSEQARADMRVLRAEAEKLQSLMQSRSWRWTRPMRVLARALGGRWSPDDSREMRKVFQRLGGARPAEVVAGEPVDDTAVAPAPPQPLRTIAEPLPGLADVFVWAVIDWDFRFQRPQHLAKALAQQGHRTFYISNNFVDSAEPGFRIDPLDGSGRLFQVNLHLAGAPAIYFGLPSEAQVSALRASLAKLLSATGTSASLSIVQHPYWLPLVRAVPNARVVYDCMDHHAGFENNAPAVLAAEQQLLRDSDLVIVTSLWLQHEVESSTRACVLVRNACEYDFFSVAPPERFQDPQGRKVIGYFGAIAEWFDLDLVRQVALDHPQALVLLVGSDTVGARETLADVSNVRFVGEVPYTKLPYWLHGFDVALLPFKVIPLTLATNPVKVYEYLAAGKPVVAVDLPEMAQFGGLVHAAKDSRDFSAAVSAALAGSSAASVQARREFAAGQTWSHRARAIDEAIACIGEDRVSLVVLTYNNLELTQACLASIEANSDYPNLEVIVVDNASSDGSREWLRDWEQAGSAAGHARRLVLNADNLGFSAGNNVGLRASTGDFLVLLNNDTYVTPGWVRTLIAHFRRDARLGLVGPVTNNIGNEARIEIAYADMGAMVAAAGEYTRAHPGESLRVRNAAFFCAAMPRAVYEAVGGLDEAFGVGFFEDDDYCRRVERAGYEIACADDVFVHHHLSASFNKLKAETKQQLFQKNKAIYEAKWGTWIPHEYRKAN
jgi:GT2 family glycosyltransferase/glycosyltransferase involved in cell wall biosynthesis